VGDTILVTGAAGFAGSHLVELLAGEGTVTGWRHAAPPPLAIASLATWQQIDLLDRDAVRRAIAELRPTRIFHCAGSPHVAESWNDTTTPLSRNVLATHHLLEALSAAGCRARIVLPGSATVYAPSTVPLTESAALHPTSPYAVAKLAQEQLALRGIAEDGVEVIVARAFNHTGPRQQPGFAAPSFARQIALIERGDAEPVVRVGNLDAQRDLTDVRDVVRAYAGLMAHGESGVVYNVCSGIATSMRRVLEGLVARARVSVRVEPDPARMRPHDVPVILGDPGRLRAATGWEPAVTFDQMLDDLLAYWRTAA
jgi:GDP-4-dehydro-6-deoxy-D-mannose reductase